MRAEHPLAGTRAPEAPAELRSRVLAVLGTEILVDRGDCWDRLWASRPLRLAWLSTVLLLLALNLAPSRAQWGTVDPDLPAALSPRPPETIAALGLDSQTLELYRQLRRETRLRERVELIVDLVGRP